MFRERFFEMMLRREKILPETVERFKSWEHSGFNVGWERKLEAHDRKGLEGLLTYIERPAVSLRRLRYREDGMVHYRGTRLHPRLGIDHQLVTPVEFLALLVPHVLLKYEITLRLYGALSTTFRRRVGWIQDPPVGRPPAESVPLPPDSRYRDLGPLSPELPTPGPSIARLEPEGQPQAGPRQAGPRQAGPRQAGDQLELAGAPATSITAPDSPSTDCEFLRKRKRSWAKLIAKLYLDDPQLCGSCQKPMKIVAVIALEQGDVIERILRHLQIWDPPWKRQRKARGPPTCPRAGSAASPHQEEAGDAYDTPIDDGLYAFDPAPPDDEGSET